jgi:dihydrodipicolinate synthase/N-acetylneuraminate lyase
MDISTVQVGNTIRIDHGYIINFSTDFFIVVDGYVGEGPDSMHILCGHSFNFVGTMTAGQSGMTSQVYNYDPMAGMVAMID